MKDMLVMRLPYSEFKESVETEKKSGVAGANCYTEYAAENVRWAACLVLGALAMCSAVANEALVATPCEPT